MMASATNVSGSRVGVVGGSIAGCAAAIALDRLGCEVTVLERSSSGLKDRGSGIAIPPALRDELVGAGYLPADYVAWEAKGRHWYVADGTDQGKRLWTQPGQALTNNWGSLWRGLRGKLPETVAYLDDSPVASVAESGSEVGVVLGDGTELTFDAVFGADGYRSLVRSLVHPDSSPVYAGYVLWRGNFPLDELGDRDAWDEVCDTGEWVTVAFDGGHGVMYPIPDLGTTEEGRLRVNWAIYAPTPSSLTLAGPASIPPGSVSDACFAEYQALLDRVMPPRFRSLFDVPQRQLSIQPVYDEEVDHYSLGRLALIGDAATLSRPHTGSGATKAMQDALQIETLGAEHSDWPGLLAAYDAERTTVGRGLVSLGRRIGRDQVEQTPRWDEMAGADFEAWAARTLSGDELYFWGDSETEPSASS